MGKYMQRLTFYLGLMVLLNQPVLSAEVNNKKNNKAEPLVIQSQVKGSQEQPNVIYIMPWQGVDKIIEVKGKQRTIKLPQFKPINPRTFKAQVHLFASKSLQPKSNEAKVSPESVER